LRLKIQGASERRKRQTVRETSQR